MTWRAPSAAYPLLACGACRRDDLGAAQRAEGDQQAAGDSAGSVDQELLTGVDVQRVAENLFGGERGYREGGRYLPAGTGRLAGEQPSRGDQPGRPGPLVSQRHRMRHHRVPRRPVADRLAHGQHCAGCLHAQRHRRLGTHVPAAGTDELIPVGHAGCPHLEQHLVPGQRPRLARLDHLNPGTHPANPSYLHLSSPRLARRADARKHPLATWLAR